VRGLAFSESRSLTLTQHFRRVLGLVEEMAARAAEAGRRWFQGKRQAGNVLRS
jgi:hypothetical protein